MTRCEIINGHVISALRQLPPESVQMIVTSPPYWGLRSYGTEPQIWGGREDCAHDFRSAGKIHRGGPAGKSEANEGRDRSALDACGDIQCGDICVHCGAWRGEHGLEPTPDLFVEHEVMIFREAWRVLRDDGTLWLNLGDTYASNGGHSDTKCNDRRGAYNLGNRPEHDHRGFRARGAGALKPKDLVGIPWRVALALQADGWYLRSDIIWHKPNPMPESVSDRPTKSHEHVFLLTKSEDYFYNEADAREPVSNTANARGSGVNPKAKQPAGWASGTGRAHNELNGRYRPKQNASFSEAVKELVSDRNWRDVWSIVTEAFPDAHYATFPSELPRRCIIAGSKPGDTVLDIFGGSGTTGQVAQELGRHALLIELLPANIKLIERRTSQAGLIFTHESH